MQRLDDRLGIPFGNAQQSERRAIGGATTLLPIAQRGDTHADHQREFDLRLPQLATQRLDIGRLEGPNARGLPLTAANLTRLAHARQQLLKCGSFHLNSSRTRRASARTCAGVRGSVVHVDFPAWIIDSLDREAARLGVTRQSLVKIWIAARLARNAPAGAGEPANR